MFRSFASRSRAASLGSLLPVAVAALVCTVAVPAQAAAASGFEVRLSVAQPVLKGDVDVHVSVSITNISRQPRQILRSQLPGAAPMSALFRISRDGQPVDYTGPVVKRGPLAEADYLTLAAGETQTFEAELTGTYDLSQNGRYAIEYIGLGKQSGAATLGELAPTYLWLEGRSPLAESRVQVEPQNPSLAGSVSYTGNCTASQKSTLASAFSAATTYSQNALSYLSGTPSGTTRYKTWFGAFTSARWNTAKSHYAAATDAFKNKAVTLDCSCKQSYFAYVYPTQPYKIYVCNAFWSAPLTGTDSKAGTLVHEMTHFNVVAATDDWAYGQSAAKSLALSNPTKALDNADSHEYFAENSPPLP
ncbi:MAG: peptidase M35 [Burkholderiales bacterium PBB2]|nr:MAG: peptidase M35 [Burkholderiales bacterium PBB2]